MELSKEQIHDLEVRVRKHFDDSVLPDIQSILIVKFNQFQEKYFLEYDEETFAMVLEEMQDGLLQNYLVVSTVVEICKRKNQKEYEYTNEKKRMEEFLRKEIYEILN